MRGKVGLFTHPRPRVEIHHVQNSEATAGNFVSKGTILSCGALQTVPDESPEHVATQMNSDLQSASASTGRWKGTQEKAGYCQSQHREDTALLPGDIEKPWKALPKGDWGESPEVYRESQEAGACFPRTKRSSVLSWRRGWASAFKRRNQRVEKQWDIKVGPGNQRA